MDSSMVIHLINTKKYDDALDILLNNKDNLIDNSITSRYNNISWNVDMMRCYIGKQEIDKAKLHMDNIISSNTQDIINVRGFGYFGTIWTFIYLYKQLHNLDFWDSTIQSYISWVINNGDKTIKSLALCDIWANKCYDLFTNDKGNINHLYDEFENSIKENLSILKLNYPEVYNNTLHWVLRILKAKNMKDEISYYQRELDLFFKEQY